MNIDDEYNLGLILFLCGFLLMAAGWVLSSFMRANDIGNWVSLLGFLCGAIGVIINIYKLISNQ